MLLKIEGQEKAPLAVIFGLSGEKLLKAEKDFFRQADPLGFILFSRNCVEPKQLKKLVDSLHDCMGRNVPVLVDQEGGRVQRLKPPHWKDYPAAQKFGEAFQNNFAKGHEYLQKTMAVLADELRENGFSVNCAPVMDVLSVDTHKAIGDRAYSADPEMVAVLGSAMCRELLRAGIIPVVKHLPGQGRAGQDSHADLPVVNASHREMRKIDFVPFKELLTRALSEAVWGMVSHIVYTDIDARAASSCSRKVIKDVIRGDIGFDGLLLSDDICMGALESMGDAGARADMVLRAGCDVVLHCNGSMPEMELVAKRAQKMTNPAIMRYNRSVSWVNRNLKNG